jgi:secreted PhoX family phosphatase
LKRSAFGAGVLAVGNVSSLFAGGTALATPGGGTGAARGYGALRPDPAGILDLPPGFSYRIVSRAGDKLANGAALPDRFDGTGAFAGRHGRVRLVRNHEQGGTTPWPTTAGTASNLTYDPGATGGTSTVELDAHGNKVAEYVSLAGTVSNCAGGATPWGTWLTCEETEQRADATTYLADHGFVFEVDPADPAHNLDPQPLTALGRYAHEAAVVDPTSGAVYLTEDAGNPNGLVYRCEPNNPQPAYGALRDGGTLTAMRCRDGGTFVPDLSPYTTIGPELAVEWVAVPDPLATTTSTRKQFQWAANAGGAPITPRAPTIPMGRTTSRSHPGVDSSCARTARACSTC